jgi:hypothetical protein
MHRLPPFARESWRSARYGARAGCGPPRVHRTLLVEISESDDPVAVSCGEARSIGATAISRSSDPACSIPDQFGPSPACPLQSGLVGRIEGAIETPQSPPRANCPFRRIEAALRLAPRGGGFAPRSNPHVLIHVHDLLNTIEEAPAGVQPLDLRQAPGIHRTEEGARHCVTSPSSESASMPSRTHCALEIFPHSRDRNLSAGTVSG